MIEKLKVGVKKIKIQYLKGVYEKEFKKDEIGKILYDSFLSEIKHINGDKNKDFKQNDNGFHSKGKTEYKKSEHKRPIYGNRNQGIAVEI